MYKKKEKGIYPWPQQLRCGFFLSSGNARDPGWVDWNRRNCKVERLVMNKSTSSSAAAAAAALYARKACMQNVAFVFRES